MNQCRSVRSYRYLIIGQPLYLNHHMQSSISQPAANQAKRRYCCATHRLLINNVCVLVPLDIYSQRTLLPTDDKTPRPFINIQSRLFITNLYPIIQSWQRSAKHISPPLHHPSCLHSLSNPPSRCLRTFSRQNLHSPRSPFSPWECILLQSLRSRRMAQQRGKPQSTIHPNNELIWIRQQLCI